MRDNSLSHSVPPRCHGVDFSHTSDSKLNGKALILSNNVSAVDGNNKPVTDYFKICDDFGQLQYSLSHDRIDNLAVVKRDYQLEDMKRTQRNSSIGAAAGISLPCRRFAPENNQT